MVHHACDVRRLDPVGPVPLVDGSRALRVSLSAGFVPTTYIPSTLWLSSDNKRMSDTLTPACSAFYKSTSK